MRATMTGAAASVLFAGVVVIAIVAPFPGHDAPVPVSDAEVRAYADRVIAATWVSTGLPGPQPDGVVADIARPDPNATSNALLDCMTAAGHPQTGYGFDEAAGYTLMDSDGIAERSDTVLATWYGCVVRHPVDSLTWSDALTSDSEEQWERRYQLNWIAPCVVLSGYPVQTPADSQILNAFQWSAYGAMWTTEPSPERAQQVMGHCGDTFSMLGGGQIVTAESAVSEKDAAG